MQATPNCILKLKFIYHVRQLVTACSSCSVASVLSERAKEEPANLRQKDLKPVSADLVYSLSACRPSPWGVQPQMMCKVTFRVIASAVLLKVATDIVLGC